jgi:flagellin-like hook-associated protein FlgL
MALSGIGLSSSLSIQAVVDMRNRLIELERQLGTGKKAESYADLGLDRGLTVGLRSHLSAIAGYQQTIDQVDVRLDIAQTVLTQISSIGQSTKTSILGSQFALNGDNETRDQKNAELQFEHVLGLLNTTTGDRYLFSGKAVDHPAVESADHILNGTGGRAGLKQLIAERRLADLGANGLGRLVVSSPTATSIAVAEDAVSPFGFKLVGAVSALSGATVSGPGGSPPAMSVDLGPGNPNDGEAIKFTFTLPDGSSQDVTLTATAASPPKPNQFVIGANSAATRANMQNALTQALGTLGRTTLEAASAIAAGKDFFTVDAGHRPQRVAGPPFDSATALVDGTDTDTVIWYVGEAGSDPARSTAIVRADQSLTMNYGIRANEEALRRTVQSIAVFASVSFSDSDPDAEGRYTELQKRTGTALADPHGQQRISDIQGELAGVQVALATTKSRHQQTDSTLSGLLDKVEGAPTEEVAAQILALQTSLQATLQTTSMLLQTNLLKYL